VVNLIKDERAFHDGIIKSVLFFTIEWIAKHLVKNVLLKLALRKASKHAVIRRWQADLVNKHRNSSKSSSSVGWRENVG